MESYKNNNLQLPRSPTESGKVYGHTVLTKTGVLDAQASGCVAIKAFSRRLETLQQGRVVMLVGASGSGRHSALLAWAKQTQRIIKGLKVESVSTTASQKQVVSAEWFDLEALSPTQNSQPSWMLEGIDTLTMPQEIEVCIEKMVASVAGQSSLFVLTHKLDIAQQAWMQHPRTVTVVDWGAIKVSNAESFAIASQHGAPTSKHVATWAKELHGWNFGLCLLAQTKFGSWTPRDALPQVIHQFIKTKIYDPLPEDFQKILKTMALLPAVDAQTCERLGIANASRLVDAHTQDCAGFVQRSALNDMHYVLHPLFRRFLWSELVTQLGQKQASALSQSILNAADTTKITDNVEVALWIENRHYAKVAQYIDDHISQVPFTLRVEAVQRLLKTLPEGEEVNHPTIAYWRAWTVRVQQPTKSKKLYMLAADGYLHKGDTPRALNSWGWAAALISMRLGAGRELDQSIAWIEKVDQTAATPTWHLHHPRLCCTVAVIVAMRAPQAQRTRQWALYALDALSLNTTQAVGSIALVGISVALLKDLDLVRLDALQIWCSSAADYLLGTNTTLVRSLARAAYSIAMGQVQLAAEILNTTPYRHDKLGGIPVCDAFLLLASPWLGVPGLSGAVQERHAAFAQLGFNTSDFRCLQLLAMAHDALVAGHHTLTHETLVLARNLSANIEFPFISEMVLLCALQYACCAQAWDEAKTLFEQLEEMRQQDARIPLFDLQKEVLQLWMEVSLNDRLKKNHPALGKIAAMRIGEDKTLLVHPVLALKIAAALHAYNNTTTTVFQGAAVPLVHLPWLPISLDATLQPDVVIRTFGKLQIQVRQADGVSWNTLALQPKLEFLLRILLIFGPDDPVTVSEICDEMWPDAEGDSAKRNFDSAVHRLRKALGHSDAVILKNSKLSLHPNLVRIDLYEILAIAQNDQINSPESAQVMINQALATVTGRLCLVKVDMGLFSAQQRRRAGQLTQVLTKLSALAKTYDLVDLASELYARNIDHLDAGLAAVQARIELLLDAGRLDQARAIFTQHANEFRLHMDGKVFDKMARLVALRL